MELTKQKKYCDKMGYPMFAPVNGICFHCRKQLPDTDKHLITGCPFCHYSYCDQVKHMTNKQETFRDVLIRLTKTNTSTENDSKIMEVLLRTLGFEQARVVSGIVYLEGRGTIKNPPASIHLMAKQLLKME